MVVKRDGVDDGDFARHLYGSTSKWPKTRIFALSDIQKVELSEFAFSASLANRVGAVLI